jgi:Sulfotransferase family
MRNQQKKEWDKPILIGSCGSSGSTLLSVMLDAHPEVLSGPELALLAHPFFWNQTGTAWRDPLLTYLDEGYRATFRPEWTLANGFCPYAGLAFDNTLPWYGLTRERLKDMIAQCANGRELTQAIYEPLLDKHGKRRWAEKSPQNVYAFRAFLDAYPHGRVVYLVRDGRDVVCSLLRKRWGGFKQALAFWLMDTAICETFRDHPRVHRVRYEDLVTHPRDTVMKVQDFLGLSPEAEQMLNFHTASARAASADASSAGQPTWHRTPTQPVGSEGVGVWREVLSPEQLACMSAATLVSAPDDFRQIVGESAERLLERLGYEPGRPAQVNHGALQRLILDEQLFLSGSDYAQRGTFGDIRAEFHETYVECDPARLPRADFSWEDKRLLLKFANVRTDLTALWAANRARQAEILALETEQKSLRAVSAIDTLYRLHQLPYRKWPRAMLRRLWRLFGGGAS